VTAGYNDVMTRRAALAIGVCVVASHARPAAADDAARASELEARGDALAKEGRFAEAIDAFKAADRVESRAAHACLIALAYSRREMWPQAELWMSRCHERWKPGDQLPDWVPITDSKIGVAAAQLAPVTVAVEPANIAATITVSTFAADEAFPARTIHLAPGHYVFSATPTTPGYTAAEAVVEIGDASAKRVVLELHALTPVTQPTPATASPVRSPKWIIVGGAIAGAGALSYVWQGYEWNQLDDAKKSGSQSQYSAHSTRFDVARITTVGLLGVGITVAILGLVQYKLGVGEHTTISAFPATGGGGVAVTWIK
jgi:hypothetical protein